MKRCPNCGLILKGDRLKFCDQCGSDLSNVRLQQNVPSERQQSGDLSTSEEKQQAYFFKEKDAWADGKLTLDEVEELSALRKQLEITDAKASELRKKAIESLRPMQQDDFDEKPQTGPSHGIALSINTNKLYMEGKPGLINLKLENLSDAAFDSVKIEISSDMLGRTESWTCQLEPCKAVAKNFKAKPADAGEELVQFRIIAKQGNSIYAYWADTGLFIFEKTEDLRNISIQADKLVEIGGVGEGKGMGNSIKANIDNLISMNKIEDANDLMREYRNMPEDFRILSIQFDPNRSEQLKNSQTMVQTSGTGKRILEPETGSLTQTASLQVQHKAPPTNIILVAKDKINLGKNRKNEIVTRICPRSPINDEKTNRISRTHCNINLTEKGVFVIDSGSANGAMFNSKKIDANGIQIKSSGKILELAEILSMKVNLLGDKRQLHIKEYEQLIESPDDLWQKACKVNLNSITLSRLENLGENDENGTESYCLLYRIATIGSDGHASIVFEDKGLEPLHAAILYFNQRFYLENLCDLADVFVGDNTVSKSELIPLSFGDRIHIARLDMKFLQKSQLFIDSLTA